VRRRVSERGLASLQDSCFAFDEAPRAPSFTSFVPTPMLIRRLLAFAALLFLGVAGLNNVTSWPSATRAAQQVATAVAVGEGLLALACIVALWRRAAALRRLLLACAAATAAAAGLAAWAWGGAPASGWLSATAIGAAMGAAAAWQAWPSREAWRAAPESGETR
jgi:hypothetical protein